MKTLIFASLLIASQHSFAGNVDVWEGAGALFGVDGKQTATYDLVVENVKIDKQTQTNVTVTLPDGKIEEIQCLMNEASPGRWTSKCDFGDGGGQCFGDGLCISYEADAKTGKAFATNIVMDGPSDMRILRTELQDGKAVQFFREKLHKK